MVSTFSERLLHARVQRGLSQNQLATLCGLSQSTIASYETGSRQHSRHIFDLAKVLKVNPLWLERGTGPMYAFKEKGQPYNNEGWPFKSLDPAQFKDLSAQQLADLEQLVQIVLKSWS